MRLRISTSRRATLLGKLEMLWLASTILQPRQFFESVFISYLTSTRARSYKMKLDEWKMWKYRSKTAEQSNYSDFSSSRTPEPVHASSNTSSPKKYIHIE